MPESSSNPNPNRNRRLTSSDLQDLADILAMQMHAWLGSRVYRLQRSDILELAEAYIDDLTPEDQKAVAWLIWHLFQDAHEIEMGRYR
ncbi:MAG: hypothetical protein HC884_01700 [Chloroflexaceae bacterium]|nr:hypothetical protein [Chloroflexaceae bacterium]